MFFNADREMSNHIPKTKKNIMKIITNQHGFCPLYNTLQKDHTDGRLG